MKEKKMVKDSKSWLAVMLCVAVLTGCGGDSAAAQRPPATQ
jgi:hypothetical protein